MQSGTRWAHQIGFTLRHISAREDAGAAPGGSSNRILLATGGGPLWHPRAHVKRGAHAASTIERSPYHPPVKTPRHPLPATRHPLIPAAPGILGNFCAATPRTVHDTSEALHRGDLRAHYSSPPMGFLYEIPQGVNTRIIVHTEPLFRYINHLQKSPETPEPASPVGMLCRTNAAPCKSSSSLGTTVRRATSAVGICRVTD